jgi:hypothetical protein
MAYGAREIQQGAEIMLDAAGVSKDVFGAKLPVAHARFGFRRRWIVCMALLAVPAAAYSAGSVDYTYDALGRVVRAVYSDGTKTTTVTYNYDASGNRTSVTANSP